MKIQVCKGPHCSFRGSDKVYNELQKCCVTTGNTVEYCHCQDNCDYGPNVIVDNKLLYDHAKPDSIVERIKNGSGKSTIPQSFEDLGLDDIL